MGAGNLEVQVWLTALGFLMAFGLIGWLISVVKRDVSIVDSMWSLMFLIAASTYVFMADTVTPRAQLTLLLVAIWAIRLAVYITWRNWGAGEDYRYQRIRENNAPNFVLKSSYIVFGLQAVLAWVISLPLLQASSSSNPLGILDYAGVLLWLVGFLFETIGDYQLAAFKKNPDNKGRVLDSGLWGFTRHPNYFGDFCVWWGFYLIALSAFGWWTIVSPILMSVLLLRVSGVAMLEKDIAERRPEYIDYIARTNAFFPGPLRTETAA